MKNILSKWNITPEELNQATVVSLVFITKRRLKKCLAKRVQAKEDIYIDHHFAKLKKWTDTLTDEELEKEYYDAFFRTIGSQADEMYERGYDPADIRDIEKYTIWLSRRIDMLEVICCERGITFWEDEGIK